MKEPARMWASSASGWAVSCSARASKLKLLLLKGGHGWAEITAKRDSGDDDSRHIVLRP
jgi:hypothetical protein